MPNPTIIMSSELEDEIDRRRPSTTSRSQWIREACVARAILEDSDRWGELVEEIEADTAEKPLEA